jgi:hypothetical protein
MGIKVVLSNEEAKSSVLEPVPLGWYKVTISDVELKEVKNAPAPGKKDNRGKPFYSIECTINEPEAYEGRKVFTNAMLFEGALYTISQIMKAMGIEVESGEVEVPEIEELLGQEFMAKVKITGARKVGDKEYEARNDIAGFKAVGEQEVKVAATTGSATSKGGNSLLPS